MNEAIQDSKMHDSLYNLKKQDFLLNISNFSRLLAKLNIYLFFRDVNPFTIYFYPVFFELGNHILYPT